ncbi:MAG: hypothetical protein FWH46_04820 [Methanimicrococcus sp.]|nr:hypothetical protein [Methanimicrococcus sp.]
MNNVFTGSESVEFLPIVILAIVVIALKFGLLTLLLKMLKSTGKMLNTLYKEDDYE